MSARAHVLGAGELVAGKYKIEHPLGAGGMSAVYRATHLGLDQAVALKMLHPEFASDLKLVQRFLREAKAAARVTGNHVGRVLDVGSTENGAPFMALELLQGEDLGAHLDRRGPLPVGEAVDLVLQACDGIARAHAVGIIHRDIKPSNLFLTERDGEPCVKVIDFGISKLVGAEDHMLTQTAEIFGSPQYMSPEQIKASRDVDARSDVWSVGCVLYELLTGKVPFEAPSVMALGAVILQDPQKPVASFRPDVPPGLEEVIAACLAKDPKGRPATMLELAVALQPFAQRQVGLIDSMRRLGTNPPIVPFSSARPVFVATMGDTEPSQMRPRPTIVEARRGRRVIYAAIGVGVLGGLAIALGATGKLRPIAKEPPPASATVVEPPAATLPVPASARPATAPATAEPPPAPAAATTATTATTAAPAVTARRGAPGKPVASAAPPKATTAEPAPAPPPPVPAPVKSSAVTRDRHGGD